MKLRTRQRPQVLPGHRATARVDRRTRAVLPKLRAGDVAVVDHRDMDRATAEALVEAEVGAVLNVSPFLSGRYPSRGPQILADAGITLVDGIGSEGIGAIKDGSRVRLHEGTLYDGEDPLAAGRVVDAKVLGDETAAARSGMAAQLDSFTRNSTEFLRREQDMLLNGRGVPRVGTPLRERNVVVVAEGDQVQTELRGIRRFIRETDPVLIGVDRGADALARAGHRPRIVVLTGRAGDLDNDGLPASEVLREADDVVVRVDHGAGRSASEHIERLGVSPVRFETDATSEDAALILADSNEASVVVGVGMHATLEDFLDTQRAGLASTYLTRLKLGTRLVDADAVPHLHGHGVRTWQLVALLLLALVTLAVAVGVTPVGQEWAGWVGDQAVAGYHYVEGRIR